MNNNNNNTTNTPQPIAQAMLAATRKPLADDWSNL